MAWKLAALLLQTRARNLVVFALAAVSVAAIGCDIPWKEFFLLHGSCLLVQFELEGICFGISAFLRRGGMGLGMGIAICMYALNIVANLTEKMKFLKYFTPFAYAEGADILTAGKLDGKLVAIGMVITAAGIAAAFWQYGRKDIHG